MSAEVPSFEHVRRSTPSSYPLYNEEEFSSNQQLYSDTYEEHYGRNEQLYSDNYEEHYRRNEQFSDNEQLYDNNDQEDNCAKSYGAHGGSDHRNKGGHRERSPLVDEDGGGLRYPTANLPPDLLLLDHVVKYVSRPHSSTSLDDSLIGGLEERW